MNDSDDALDSFGSVFVLRRRRCHGVTEVELCVPSGSSFSTDINCRWDTNNFKLHIMINSNPGNPINHKNHSSDKLQFSYCL